jgi:hypothetical protein
MAEPGTRLFRQTRKCAGKRRRISHIRPELVFRSAQEKSAHCANEISALRSKLVFRNIPGQLVQRRWQAQRFRFRIALCGTLLDPPGGRVVRVAPAPAGLGLLPSRALALRFAAGVLSITYPRVRPKPLPTYPAWSLPGLWHGDPSSFPPLWQRLNSRSDPSIFGIIKALLPSAERPCHATNVGRGDFSDLPFAVTSDVELISHRVPRALFREDLAALKGCIYHVGNPDLKTKTDAGIFFAYDLLSDRCAERSMFLEFRPEFISAMRHMLKRLIDASPVHQILFTSDWQFGPERPYRSSVVTLDQFWSLHDTRKLQLNAAYPITDPSAASSPRRGQS